MSLRGRGIKPGFWNNEGLGAIAFEWRLLFAGLWCIADREGLLEERPDRIHVQLFPYDHKLDIRKGLETLAERGFILRYEAQGQPLIQVVNFKRHQSPHHTERRSTLPAPAAGTQAVMSFPEHTRALTTEYLQRIWALRTPAGATAFQDPAWLEWITAAIAAIVEHGQGTALEETLHYIEMCADPRQRRTKDLGQLKNPAGYLVKSIRNLADATSIQLPPAPRVRRAALSA